MLAQYLSVADGPGLAEVLQGVPYAPCEIQARLACRLWMSSSLSMRTTGAYDLSWLTFMQ